MSRFPDRFLDDLRAALPVSAVVGRRMRLKRASKKDEWVAVDNQSFTVNDAKGIWHDFGTKPGKSTGDIFDFEMENGGGSFHAVVVDLAKRAGLRLPPGTSPEAPGGKPGRGAPQDSSPGDRVGNGHDRHAEPGGAPQDRDEPRKIVAAYDCPIRLPANFGIANIRMSDCRFATAFDSRAGVQLGPIQ